MFQQSRSEAKVSIETDTEALVKKVITSRLAATQEAQIAKKAGLHYVLDSSPGITRLGKPGRFRYQDKNGKLLTNRSVHQRIRALVIPPAWANVWICTSGNGHLQATGRDARGRKQYRYHARWREIRDKDKYAQLRGFVQDLPAMRNAVRAHLALPGLPRQKVLAAVVRLLETTLIRVGNEKYAQENGSFGLTTFRNRHVKIRGQHIAFDFLGKSGKNHHIELRDAKLASIVSRCRELPGQDLFQYLDESGRRQSISSTDVNEYLNTISGGRGYTAKTFRTWAGTVQAAIALRQLEPGTSERQLKKDVTQAVKFVAEQLGNTPAICRKCYIHPGVIDAYRSKRLTKLVIKNDGENQQLTRISELALIRMLTGRPSHRPN